MDADASEQPRNTCNFRAFAVCGRSGALARHRTPAIPLLEHRCRGQEQEQERRETGTSGREGGRADEECQRMSQ